MYYEEDIYDEYLVFVHIKYLHWNTVINLWHMHNHASYRNLFSNVRFSSTDSKRPVPESWRCTPTSGVWSPVAPTVIRPRPTPRTSWSHRATHSKWSPSYRRIPNSVYGWTNSSSRNPIGIGSVPDPRWRVIDMVSRTDRSSSSHPPLVSQ